jgi:hypothetical protein
MKRCFLNNSYREIENKKTMPRGNYTIYKEKEQISGTKNAICLILCKKDPPDQYKFKSALKSDGV